MNTGNNNINLYKPTEDLLRAIDIHELLPQREPFVMIGNIVFFDNAKTVTETKIKPDNIFVDGECLSASGLIENIAQTCAARIGYYNKFILGKSIQFGFIGAIRNLEINKLPKTGDTITTTVGILEEVFGITLAAASVRMGNELLATTKIKIALKDDTESIQNLRHKIQ